MKYDDLEPTKDLFDIVDVPSPIDNIEMEGVNKINVSPEETKSSTKKEEPITRETKNKNKNSKKSLKEKWRNLSSKKKAIFLVIVALVTVLLVTLIVYLCLNKSKKPVMDNPKPEAPTVIVEKENYIYKNGTLTFLDKTEQEIGTYECQNKDENLCYVINYSDEDNFDAPKNVYEDGSVIPRRSEIYGDNYVFIYDNTSNTDGLIILYNIKEQKDEGKYLLVKGFADSNFVILKNDNNKYGAVEISSSGIKEKMAFTFDYLGRLDKESKVVGKTNKRYFIYNLDGKLESKGLASEIKSYNNKYIVSAGDSYNVYDYKGEKVLKDSADYMALLEDYVLLIKDKKLFIRDYEDNLYNAEGIEIDSLDYNVKYVYSAEKVLTETKKAFEIEFEKNLIHINYVRRNTAKTTTIDTYEGKLNANMDYISYYTDKLYFYSDEAKTKLIGTYTCSNKNIIDKNTKTFSNCGLASESFYSVNEIEQDNSTNLGLLPIFNERYAFIYDNIDKENPTIILYDLKNNRQLSKYASVDAGIYEKNDKVNFKIAKNTYIMAQNKSNHKYGVINISDDKVSGIIPFEYDTLEKLRDYYLVGEDNGNYCLLDKTGLAVSGHYPYKIVDYLGKIYKVKNNDSYGIMNEAGEKIADINYLDIVLRDSYYLAVNKEKALEIFKYSGNFKLNTPISLGDDFKNNYEVTKVGEGFKVTIKNTNEVISIDNKGYRPGEEPKTPVVTDPDTPDNPADIPNNNTNDDNPIE